MATMNPSDLFGYHAEDPSQLIATEQLKAVTSAVTAVPTKNGAAAWLGGQLALQNKPDQLPTKPHPPSQAVREARNESSCGGCGCGRGSGRGFNRDPSNDKNSYPANGAPGNQGPFAEGDAEKGSERRGFGGPQGPYHGGHRGGFSNGEAGEEGCPRRAFECLRATGHGTKFKREGAGRGNWETQTDEIAQVTDEAVNETEMRFHDEPAVEDDVTDGTKDRPANDNEEKEPEDKEMTLEEYQKVLEEKRKTLQELKTEERKVDMKEFESMQQPLSIKKDCDATFVKLGSYKDKRKEAFEKEEKHYSWKSNMYIQKKRVFPYPNDLIEEIMLRLPVKSLIRFKSVCNSWNSLIFDLDVAPTTTRLLCMDILGHDVLSIDVDESILCHRKLPLPIPRIPSDFSFQGSCKGFVLIVHYPKLTVWNPTTGVRRALSCTPFTANVICRSSALHIPINLWGGLGYKASSDDYLIVMGWHQELKPLKIHAEFFSFRTNMWKEIEVVSYNFLYRITTWGSKAGKFLNGSLHWLAATKENDRADVIIAFDLEGNNFTEIPLPQGILHGRFYSLEILGEWLGVCNETYKEAVIWVMKEYKLESSWTMIDKVVLPNDIRSAALCMTKDQRVVASNEMRHLVKFSHNGKYAEHQPNFIDHHHINMMIAYTESLLSLPRDNVNEVDEDNDN